MVNTSISLAGLDFANIKANLKDFLKSQSQFADINYEGSNINVLLDVMSYNTFMNSFYLNMALSEMFLDSAQLYESVVSHAKELNYVPSSSRSSKATLKLTITPSSSVDTVTIPKYTSFSAKVGSNNYTFVTNDSVVLTSSNGVFVANTIDVYEGSVITESYVVDYANTSQRFTISNQNADTDSVYIEVYEDNSSTPIIYTYKTSLFGVTSTSANFFLQAAENKKYDIIFGDGSVGKRPKNNSVVQVSYRITNATEPNGASTFTSDGNIDGHANVIIDTVTVASGGSEPESLESIKFYAPRYFQTQERAVTSSDYETLLKSRFSDIQSISVYGGEEANPPQYGKVFIAVDVQDADGVPENRKQVYRDYIIDKTALTIDPVFIDPDFMYVEVVSNVRYNVNTTAKLSSDIKTLAINAITNYSNLNLRNFNTTLRYSKLVKAIDDSDTSIVSNDTTIRAIKAFTPTYNIPQNITIDFNTALETVYETPSTDHPESTAHAIISSIFTFEGNKSILEDIQNGTLGDVYISNLSGTIHKPRLKVGTIDYATGRVTLTNFNVEGAENNIIKIYALTAIKDISASKNTILQINPEDVTINVIGVKE